MHLLNWDGFTVRVDGGRVNEMAHLQAKGAVEDLRIAFLRGRIHISGKKKVAFVSVPFSADVSAISVEGKTIVVPVTNVAHIPTPLLSGLLLPVVRNLLSSKMPGDAVTLRPPLTLLIRLDRFLPNFVDVQIETIDIIEGGLAVRMGPGGATPPPPGGKR